MQFIVVTYLDSCHCTVVKNHCFTLLMILNFYNFMWQSQLDLSCFQLLAVGCYSFSWICQYDICNIYWIIDILGPPLLLYTIIFHNRLRHTFFGMKFQSCSWQKFVILEPLSWYCWIIVLVCDYYDTHYLWNEWNTVHTK